MTPSPTCESEDDRYSSASALPIFRNCGAVSDAGGKEISSVFYFFIFYFFEIVIFVFLIFVLPFLFLFFFFSKIIRSVCVLL